ncbi:DNA-directed RNA polymerase subunit A'' [Archaeoglobales archaeon]|nr:MAG: DNA-directed RNA polymerase subunit A'' [Archaeoglobales archaeon]
MSKVNYDLLLDEYPFPDSVKKEIKSELEKYNLPKSKAKKVIDKCFEAYLANLMEPGEAAGIVAAQSIGEPGTQMSLPSYEEIIVKIGEEIKIVSIGKFVDQCIEEFGSVKIGEYEICNLPIEVKVLSLDFNESLYWKQIACVIRHSYNGQLLKIKTKSGRKIVATPYHSFITKKEVIQPISGKELKTGDRIPVLKYLPINCIKAVSVDLNNKPHFLELNRYLGFILGMSIGCGVTQNGVMIIKCQNAGKLNKLQKCFDALNLNYKIGNSCILTDQTEIVELGKTTKKQIPDYFLSADNEFIIGIIEGLIFDLLNEKKDSVEIQGSKEYIDKLALLFSRLGIFSIKDNLGEKYLLRIKTSELEKIKGFTRKEEIEWDEIVEIGKISYSGYLYDISVDGLETFTTADGVITHNTMRTFHYAGVAEINVTLGLPRLIEILDVRKNPSTPMMTIRLLPEYARDKNKAREVANRIEATYVRDVADIEVDIRNMRIIIKPDENSLKEKGISLDDLRNKIVKSVKTEITEDNGTFVLEISEPSYKTLMSSFEKLKDTVVVGIKEIKRVIVRREEDEYVLYTEGSNLKKVMKVRGVDFTRTITNNIYEIYEVLGIEAARNAIIREALDTLEEQGLEVDARHIMLVADVMTADGELKQIGRHGVAGEKQSILARAAFEMTVNNLLEAAVKGETDGLRGITENIIVGQPIKLGTGDVELIARLEGRK